MTPPNPPRPTATSHAAPGDAPRLSLDDAALAATLVIPPHTDAALRSTLALQALLDERGISPARIDRAALSDLAARAANEPRSQHTAVVATGTPPVHGTDGTFTLAPPIAALAATLDRRAALLRSADPAALTADTCALRDPTGCPVNFYDQTAFIIVRAGEFLGTLAAPTQGSDGVDCRGAVIPAKPGRPAPVSLAAAARVDHAGRATASISGRLIIEPASLAIEPELTIRADVGFATGNIDFPGPVSVSGGVPDRFRVRSSADLVIKQLVGAAHLHADGSITLTTGMAARDSGSLFANLDCAARYLDSVRGTVGRCLRVEREIASCTLDVLGRIDAPRASLRGGRVSCAGTALLAAVGTPSGAPTRLLLGLHATLADTARRGLGMAPRLERFRAGLERRLASLKRITRPDPAQIEELMRLDFESRTAIELHATLAMGIDRAAATYRAYVTARCLVARTIFHRAEIALPGFLLRFIRDLPGPVEITLDEQGQPVARRPSASRGASPTVVELRDFAAVTPDDTVPRLEQLGHLAPAAA